MATQLMKDWIVELHNPEREQVKGYLGRVNNGAKSNCCLGVLCEVKGIEPTYRSAGIDSFTLVYDGETALPRSSVINEVLGRAEQYGPCTVHLFENDDDEAVAADEANDNYGLSFKEIAGHLMDQYLNEEEKSEVRKRIEDNGWD